MAELTTEQRAAVESRGKVIVSASAGSGKTFVMIEKLTRAIEDGADLDNVLAVTFTKKAAAQMKERLRSSLIQKLNGADGQKKQRLKAQISKISSADISTIHSFCARLLRTHFYVLGIDGGFDITADDDPAAKDLKERALENLFERGYESGDEGFLRLVKRFSKKRSDGALKKLVLESYARVRNVARYRDALINAPAIYTDEGFCEVCGELDGIFAEKYRAIAAEVRKFEKNFPKTGNAPVYAKIFAEMISAAESSAEGGLFAPFIPFTSTAKPRDKEEDRAAGELFKNFRDGIIKRYNSVREGIADENAEREAFFASGETAVDFCRLLCGFDEEYSRIKRDENKLDYNDLEHLTLDLLQNENIKKEINGKYKYVFVDEYQDVNPVQEEIISAMDGEVFLVGDIKQAIYGFRGSKSLFFAEKYNRFKGEGSALRLSDNFRSSAEVIDFVNRLFSEAMREEVCGFDYALHSKMTSGGAYPEGSGGADILIFGKDGEAEREKGVYSVTENSRPAPHTREGLAVLKLVEEELSKKRYDIKKGEYVDVQPGDICILTRKNAGGQAEGIVRALRDAGYAVAGAQEGNICALPEVKQVLDILSLIDNAEQDIPLVTAMLSPLGGFTEDEAAAIRIAFRREGRIPFRKCCALYLKYGRDEIAKKLGTFFEKLNNLRALSQILTAEELIDTLISESGLEAVYSSGTGEKLKNVLRLAAEGNKLSLPAFLARIKAGGYSINAPAAVPYGSITVMTMHAAKGLEFPIVILADICRTFKGNDAEILPFDDKYGFAPKRFDTQKMLVRSTVLRKLVKLRAEREELKNELNLFYVACTRAMCRLHILASEAAPYSPEGVLRAKCYAQTFDMGKFAVTELKPAEDGSGGTEVDIIVPADDGAYAAVSSRFMQPYAHEESVELPVKSSASAIIKSMQEDEPYFAEHDLFGEEKVYEGQTGAERGTAYHRFLELCDFNLKSCDNVREELANFVRRGQMTAEQAELLSAEKLSQILNMSVFDDLAGAEIYREREFLCRLKASEVLGVRAEDYVLVQGAIDLMARVGDKVRIIDYKYSKKTDEELTATYSAQLGLYKKAVSAITGTSPENISTAIVNLYACRQIILK